MSTRRERDRRASAGGPRDPAPPPDDRSPLELLQEEGPLGFARAYRIVLWRVGMAVTAVAAVVIIAVGGLTGEDRVGQQRIFVTKAQQLCADADARVEAVPGQGTDAGAASASPAGAAGATPTAAPPAAAGDGTGEEAALGGEIASQNASVRLKLSGDLAALQPRTEQVGNVRRLRTQLERRSSIETQIARLQGDGADPLSARDKRKLDGLRGEYASTAIVLQALSSALEGPACADV